MKKIKYCKMKEILIIVFLICQSNLSQGQNLLKEYVYVYESDIPRIQYNSFEVKRKYWSDTLFSDFGILCIDTSNLCSLTFCYNKSIWTLDQCGVKNKLFNDNMKLNRIQFCEKTIIPRNIYIAKNDTIYSFTCRNESYRQTTNFNEYLFSIKYGIIGILTPGVFYKRTDYNLVGNRKELMDCEVNW